MERIIIIILLLLNLFLLGVVLTDRVQARRGENDSAASVTAVLLDHGVSVDEDAELVQTAPVKCTLTRSMEQEENAVQRLLGNASREDLGGNIIYYRGTQGQVVFRGSGEVEALFSNGTIRTRGNRKKTAERLLKKLGIRTEFIEEGINSADGEAYVRFCCCREDYPVFNAVLHLDYSGDSVYMLTGTRIFETAAETDGAAGMDSVSALLRFVELLRNGEFSCTCLSGIRPGYYLSVLVSGESTLTPVWQLETDGGTLLINAENGRVESGLA